MIKRDIYKIVAIENGLQLDMSVLEYLAIKFTDEDSVKSFIERFKIKFSNHKLEKSQIDNILSEHETTRPFFEIKEFKMKKVDLINKYERYKRVSDYNKSDTSRFYGMFYVDKLNRRILENEDGVFILDFGLYDEDMFLYEDMIITVKGELNEDVITVESIILPEIPIFNKVNNFLIKTPIRICVFGNYINEDKFVQNVISEYYPNLLLMSVNNKRAIQTWNTDTIYIPSKNNLIETYEGTLSKKEKSQYSIKINNNPIYIDFYDKRIVFIDHNIFQYKEKGLFFNSNPFESFYNSFISQGSTNPFNINSDLELNPHPNYFIISQDSPPYVYRTTQNVLIISIPTVKSKGFTLIDIERDKCEIIYK
ncbi:hypothetical protein A0H76_39 [Hepatospora eriocheir]|uniref:Uncharacterized protein n=1 Tax=Hepatospora eriocheir TaxID=1081669 RepID=A0A1X0QJI3_9MICR|nr:hypothetical protein A0H76_39 [Hepatospora eriocheir]